MVVRLAGNDLVRAVELLQQDNASQLVGKRERSQRQAMVSLLELEPERAADHKRQVSAGRPALFDEAGESLARVTRPIARKQRDVGALMQTRHDFFAVAQLDLLDARIAPEELGVMTDGVSVRSAQAPNRDYDETHALRY